MSKISNLVTICICLLIASVSVCIANSYTVDSSVYSDLILTKYNKSCFESANWQFVRVNSSVGNREGYAEGNYILIKEVKVLGEKSVLADVIFYN